MATFYMATGSDWAGIPLTFVISRSTTQLGTISATETELASGQLVFSGVVDTSGFSDGIALLSLIDSFGNLAALNEIHIKDGSVVAPLTDLTNMITGSGTDTPQWTEDSVSNTATFSVIASVNQGRRQLSNLEAFIGETSTITIPTIDTDGTLLDLSDQTIEVCFELSRLDKATVADADINKFSGYIQFDLPAAAVNPDFVSSSQASKNLHFSVRRVVDKYVFAYGVFTLKYAPLIG